MTVNRDGPAVAAVAKMSGGDAISLLGKTGRVAFVVLGFTHRCVTDVAGETSAQVDRHAGAQGHAGHVGHALAINPGATGIAVVLKGGPGIAGLEVPPHAINRVPHELGLEAAGRDFLGIHHDKVRGIRHGALKLVAIHLRPKREQAAAETSLGRPKGHAHFAGPLALVVKPGQRRAAGEGAVAFGLLRE